MVAVCSRKHMAWEGAVRTLALMVFSRHVSSRMLAGGMLHDCTPSSHP